MNIAVMDQIGKMLIADFSTLNFHREEEPDDNEHDAEYVARSKRGNYSVIVSVLKDHPTDRMAFLIEYYETNLGIKPAGKIRIDFPMDVSVKIIKTIENSIARQIMKSVKEWKWQL